MLTTPPLVETSIDRVFEGARGIQTLTPKAKNGISVRTKLNPVKIALNATLNGSQPGRIESELGSRLGASRVAYTAIASFPTLPAS
jgi:hypothetical protein